MQKYLLDTGIILGYVRAAPYAEYVEKKYRLFDPPNIPLISIVSKGEMYSLATQFQGGAGKLKQLDELLRKLPWLISTRIKLSGVMQKSIVIV